MFVESLVTTDGKVIGSSEGFKLRYTDCIVLGTLLRYVYGITLGLDLGTELEYID